jgi:multimeric flavodoxin WrbA
MTYRGVIKMSKEKVKILGVSGSPRRNGNTATMMKFALKAAETMDYVETEFVSLGDHKLVPCCGCMKCFGWQAPADDPYKCYKYNDDIEILAPKVAEADGMIVGFPIYAAGVPSLFRCFMEKLHHFGPMSFTRHAGALRFKALGIVSCVDGTAVYGEKAWTKAGCRTVPPVQGSRNERTLRNLGRNMAVTAMSLKLGRLAFKDAGYEEPENISFTRYSVKPRKGSYVDRLIQEGKVEFVSKEQLKAQMQQRAG